MALFYCESNSFIGLLLLLLLLLLLTEMLSSNCSSFFLFPSLKLPIFYYKSFYSIVIKIAEK